MISDLLPFMADIIQLFSNDVSCCEMFDEIMINFKKERARISNRGGNFLDGWCEGEICRGMGESKVSTGGVR